MFDRDIWISDSLAIDGGCVDYAIGNRKIEVRLPPNCGGKRIRLKQSGEISWLGSLLGQERPDTTLRVRTFQGGVRIDPPHANSLNEHELANQARIMAHAEWLLRTGTYRVLRDSVSLESVAQSFNCNNGYPGVLNYLSRHLGLYANIVLDPPRQLDHPGHCVFNRRFSGPSECAMSYEFTDYSIVYDQKYQTSLAAVAAILAHELCHVVYDVYYDTTPTYKSPLSSSSPELNQTVEERVDALVCLAGLSGFQVQASRTTGVVFGYYLQKVFEWMHFRLLHFRRSTY